jgi:hypothetical protein
MTLQNLATRLRLSADGVVRVGILLCAVVWFVSWKQPVLGSPANEPPVLQAVMTEGTAYMSYKYLYVRVFEDGTAEYHDVLSVDLTKPIPLLRRVLPQADVAGVTAVLCLPVVQKLSGAFEREDMGDVRETMDIEIRRGGDIQKVRLVNFHSDRDVPDRPRYTEAAVRLGCIVDRLRNKAESSGWESEECKQLPTVN